MGEIIYSLFSGAFGKKVLRRKVKRISKSRSERIPIKVWHKKQTDSYE